MLREASDETVAAKEAEVHLAKDSHTGDPRSCANGPETCEDQCRKESEPAEDPAQPPTGIPTLVNVLLHPPKTKPLWMPHTQGVLVFSFEYLLNQDLGPKADYGRLFMRISPRALKTHYSFHMGSEY